MSTGWKKWQKEFEESLEKSSEKAIDAFIKNDKFFKLKEQLGILSPSLTQLGYYDKKGAYVQENPCGEIHLPMDADFIIGDCYYAYDIEYVIDKLLNSEKEKQMEKLYYNSADEEYGTILAYDKNGNAVFEPRGGGKIKQVSPDSLEEVKPYTVEVKYVGNRGEATYGFQVDKDAGLKVGDIVYATDYNQFVVVVGVDTQTDFATKRLKGNLMTLGQTLE